MIIEQRDYHVYAGKLPEVLRLYEDEGIPIQQEILGGLVGAFTTEIGALSTYSRSSPVARRGSDAAIAAGLEAEGAEVVIADLEPPEGGTRADVSSEDDVTHGGGRLSSETVASISSPTTPGWVKIVNISSGTLFRCVAFHLH